MNICNFPLMDQVCGVGDAVNFASDPGKAIGARIAKSAAQLAASAADLAAETTDKTTSIDLNAGWFVHNYETILPIGLMLIVATLCAQLVRAAWRRDGQALGQAFTGTIGAVLFAFAAISLTTVALTVVDTLSDGLFAAAHSSIETAVRRTVDVGEYGGLYSMGWLVPTLVALAAALGALIFWCVMLIRKVGVLILVTLASLAAAGGAWEATRRWRRGWIEAAATLVASKLVMTIVFLLGVSAMGAPASSGPAALSDALAGIVVMAMVLLCPYAIYRFVHWAGDGRGEDVHRASSAGMQIARQHAERAVRKAAAMGAAGGVGAAAPQGPPSVPGQGPGGVIAADPTGTPGPGNGLPPEPDQQQTGGDPGGQPATAPPQAWNATASATNAPTVPPAGTGAPTSATAPPPPSGD